MTNIKPCLNRVGYEKVLAISSPVWRGLGLGASHVTRAVHRTWSRLTGKKWDINRFVWTLHCTKWVLLWHLCSKLTSNCIDRFLVYKHRFPPWVLDSNIRMHQEWVLRTQGRVSVVKVQSCSCAPDSNYQQLLAESGNRQPEQLKCGKWGLSWGHQPLPVQNYTNQTFGSWSCRTDPAPSRQWLCGMKRGAEEQREKGEKREYLGQWTVQRSSVASTASTPPPAREQ